MLSTGIASHLFSWPRPMMMIAHFSVKRCHTPSDAISFCVLLIRLIRFSILFSFSFDVYLFGRLCSRGIECIVLKAIAISIATDTSTSDIDTIQHNPPNKYWYFRAAAKLNMLTIFGFAISFSKCIWHSNRLKFQNYIQIVLHKCWVTC